jgi:Lon protease-like protein
MICQSPFDPKFGELPDSLPIFPLTGVLLLPRGRLPLNVFEPRYLSMVEDALKGDRMIGMIQPCGDSDPPPVFSTGCAGRIVSFTESDDGRYLISLSGLCRFTVAKELESQRGYRRIQPDWAPFKGDMDEEQCPGLQRSQFISLLQAYFHRQGLSANWDAIGESPDERLLTSLAMICPFEPSEKQALLEAPDLASRAEIMVQLLEMAIADQPDWDRSRH